jgi:zinc transport system permease protein
MLWKKMSYFGDAFSHSITLGLVLGLFFEVNQIWAILAFAIIFAALITIILRNNYFSTDTIVMIVSYFSVAIAIILNSLWLKDFNISSYIFGDILAVENFDVIALFISSIAVMIYAFFAFRKILLININEDFAKIEKVKTELWNLSFLILLAVVIAFSIKVVGILLMTALLIMPAAIARIFSTSPKQMILLAFLISICGAISSFKIAGNYDLTISATIVVVFGLLFFTSLALKKYFIER